MRYLKSLVYKWLPDPDKVAGLNIIFGVIWLLLIIGVFAFSVLLNHLFPPPQPPESGNLIQRSEIRQRAYVLISEPDRINAELSIAYARRAGADYGEVLVMITQAMPPLKKGDLVMLHWVHTRPLYRGDDYGIDLTPIAYPYRGQLPPQ